VEYRFVNQLPPGCTFIPEKNLPAGLPRLDTGCTQGAITYLLPQEFVKLDLLQQALLILHERFHSYAPNEPYEVKAAVISGIYSLFAKYDTLKEGEELSAETLEVLNGFIGRFRQLSRSKFGRNLTFHSNGSIYDPSDVGTGVTVGFKTRISGLKIRGNVSIEKSELICFGETLVAVDLQIRGTSGCVSGTIYRGHIVDSGVGIEIQGDDVEIVRSQVLDASSGAESKLSARRIQIMDSITSGSIDAREIEVKKSEVACKIVSKGRVLLNEVKSLNTEHRLWRATTLELETGFLGGVTIERSQWNDQVDRVYAIKANEIVIRDSSFIDARARIDALSVNANVELREVTLRGVYLQGQGMKLVRASLARVDSVKDGNFTGVTSIGQLELSNAHLELIARDAGWTEVEVGRKNGHLTLDGRGQKYQFSKTQSLKSQRDLDKRLVK
jgi:hypothetical protein